MRYVQKWNQILSSKRKHINQNYPPNGTLESRLQDPIPSANSSNYLLIVVDEFLHFPLDFPGKNIASSSVIKCLIKLFTFTSTPSYIYTDNAASFASCEFKQYLLKRGIASSKSSIYHPAGNGQAEKTVGTGWKAVQLALCTSNLPLSHYESVLNDVLYFIRSLLCVAIDSTPHEQFYNF